MRKLTLSVIAATLAVGFTASPAMAKEDRSSGRKAQERKTAEIPVCTRKLGTISIDEPETKWWSELGLSSPEAILKLFVTRSGCFGLVDRGRGLAARSVERQLADEGELQRGSNIGRGQVKAADYTLIPDIVSKNSNSGGSGIGGVLGGALGGRVLGGIIGGLRVSKKEANVTLQLTNVRTTEIERVVEGYARKSDVGFGGGAGGFWGGGLAAVGGSSYQNTEIGQVLVLAYLDAYTNMVRQLGGLPTDPSAAAPQAR